MAETIRHISVVELDFHHDSLDGFLKIFENCPVRVSAFTTAKNLELLKSVKYPDNVRFYVFSGGSRFWFLRRHRQVLLDSQVIFINTIANHFGAYLAIPKQLCTVLRVHNVNKQFSPASHVLRPRTLFFTWKFVSYVLREVVFGGFWLFRPMINARIRRFTFPDEGISAHVRQMGYLDNERILPSIPLKIFREEDTALTAYSSQLHVTIIGATDARRRYYEPVVEGLKRLYSEPDAPAIRLTLLGNCANAYGQRIRDELATITDPRFSVKSYASPVPEGEFIQQIKATHLIISPITANASTDIFREVYGQTKTTGSILDFMKFGKVTLVPSHYQPPAELQRFILKYNDAGTLVQLLRQLCENGSINALQQRSLDYVRKNYSQAEVQKSTLAIFTQLANA